MNGHFDVQKFSARGLRDADFEQALAAGELDRLLLELPKVGPKCGGKNRIFDNMAGYLLDMLFKFPASGWPFYLLDAGAGAQAMLAHITLLSTDGDTTSYTEDWGIDDNPTYATIHDRPDSVNTSSAGKRFEEDQIEPWTIWTNTQGREAIHFKNKFLYLPTQGNPVSYGATDIRSIGIYYHADADWTGDYFPSRAITGRVRLKDVNGNKVALTKNDDEILIVEYTFTLVSV